MIVLCSIPIGRFIGALPPGWPERDGFVLAHHGLGLVLAHGEAWELLGWQAAWPDLADASWAARLANWHAAVLPLELVGLITLHVAAVLKRHVLDGQRAAVRRMLG